MDPPAQYTHDRWEALARVRALWTRPWLTLDTTQARERLDPLGLLGDIQGKQVLCLASGGGQQSAAFAVLGAQVTVVDLSETQLARDQEAAAHYGHAVQTVQADMRDLSALASASFDIVWHPYAINFIPDCRPVLREVARVIRPGGLYHVMTSNPFVFGIGTRDWNGHAFELNRPYIEGALFTNADETWVGKGEESRTIAGPREYRHTLGTLLNSLADNGFVLWRTQEYTKPMPDDVTPGDWHHLVSVAPPWLMFWALYRPDTLPPAPTAV
jgi:SAM-dependent methyltransferase